MTDDSLVRVEALDVHFTLRKWGLFTAGTVRALDDIAFTLGQGESVAFVGESGCGKSTLARTLMGLNRPSAGRVVVDGQEPARLDRTAMRAYRARIGYVQQDPYGALAPFMDVRRILAEPLIIHGWRDRAQREARIRAVLDEVRLSPPEAFLDKFPHMLSGGQQQRVVIARALVLEPVLMIADEPVSMLDASVRVEILTLLRRIQTERHLTLAFITHDLSTVRHYADRIFVMYAGRLVESASVERLLDRPLHPYTQALLAALAEPDAANAGRLRDIPPGEPPSLIAPPPGCRFHPRCRHVIAGLCDRDDPPAFEAEPDHASACWLHRDGG